MKAPAFPDNEQQRLAVLYNLALLDTPADANFDRITRLTRAALNVKTVLVSLVDANRQWFKSRQGLDATQTPRAVSFCGHAILGENLFEISDALKDSRFADNPLVTGDAQVRFYAGIPLRSRHGFAMGTLCLIDKVPRVLTPLEREMFADYAALAELELQRHEQTDQTLQNREQLLRTIIDNIPMNIYVKDREARKVLANRAELDHLGLANEADVLGKHDRDLYPSNLIDQSEREDRAVLDRGESILLLENKGANKDGDSAWFRVSKLPLRNQYDDVIGLVGLSLDVTEDRHIKSKLRDQLKFLAELNEIAADAKSSLDDRLSRVLALGCEHLSLDVGIISKVEKSNYRVQWCQVPDTQSLSPGDEFPLGSTYCSLVMENEGEMVINSVAGSVLEEHPCYILFNLETYVGIRLVVESKVYGTLNFSALQGRKEPLSETDLAFVRLLGRWVESALVRDQNRRLLQQRESRLRGLFELSPLGVSLSDVDTGELLAVNDALTHQSGYSRDALLNLRKEDLLLNQQDIIGQLESTTDQDQFGPIECDISGYNGQHYPVRVRGLKMLDVDSRHLLWTIYEDISDQRRIEQLKDELVSTVSHELRTPLTSISGSLKLLAAGHLGGLTEPASNMVGIALKNTERLILLVNDLLDLDKLVAGRISFDMKKIPLSQLLKTTMDNIVGYSNLHHVAVVVGSVADVAVEVDANRFEQVMANLLSNAIKYSPKDGQVTINTHVSHCQVTISVSDNGPGVPDDFKDRIFQRFSQADSRTSREKGGTGLGLVISQNIMVSMGGNISFESQPGLTEFRVAVQCFQNEVS
ncbi:ATP-binding protein [Reinekea sp.]|jgi:PAS domain S-box-containing protein|uniref:ATP-binding protein n=1 Tax=Reinekea sp. TaxID=1970455 RepID=UPI0039892519